MWQQPAQQSPKRPAATLGPGPMHISACNLSTSQASAEVGGGGAVYVGIWDVPKK